MPTITPGSSQRAVYSDRNPAPTSNTYDNTVGPHVLVNRWSYTVPAGKKAFVEHVLVSVYRETVAAPVGTVEGLIAYLPLGGGAQNVMHDLIDTNIVGDSAQRESGTFGLMVATDQLVGQSRDTGTGGTIRYVITEKHTEFDA